MSAGTIWCDGTGDGSSLTAHLTMSTIATLRSVQSQGFDFSFSQNGALELITTREQLRLKLPAYSRRRQRGYECELLTQAEAHSMCPALRGGNVIAAIHTPLSGHVEPGMATHAIAAAAESSGARIMEEQEVVAIKRGQPGPAAAEGYVLRLVHEAPSSSHG